MTGTTGWARHGTGLLASTIFAFGLAVLATPAPAQDAQVLALGKQLWGSKAPCRDCHGSTGNGVPDVPQEPEGANLHTTPLTREQLAEVIRCGRPGTGMPSFDRNAYTDDRCYGMTAADLGDQQPPPGTPPLSDREVNAIVEYIVATFVGKDEGAAPEAEH